MSLEMLINLQGRLKSSGFSFSVEQFVNAYCMRQRQQRRNINHKYHLNPLYHTQKLINYTSVQIEGHQGYLYNSWDKILNPQPYFNHNEISQSELFNFTPQERQSAHREIYMSIIGLPWPLINNWADWRKWKCYM